MILAIETSSNLCSVTFSKDGKSIETFSSDAPMQHATLIGQFVEKGLETVGDDLRLVVVAIGPGSFTGLRIGLSYAQGFCFGRNLPIVGISNHQVLAEQATTSHKKYSIIDARRDEVYLASHKKNDLHTIEHHQIVNIADLAEHVEPGSEIIAHSAISINAAAEEAVQQKEIILSRKDYASEVLARLGEKQFAEKGADDLQTLEPMYIRPFAGVE